MREKTVIGVDSRTWTVRTATEWSVPGTASDGFEHDVSSGGGTLIVLIPLFTAWAVLFIWKPAQVIMPWFYWLIALIILGWFPFRWWMKQSILLHAQTEGTYEYPAEEWAGSVRGRRRVREEVRIVVRRLHTQGTPAHADSPLQPIGAPQLRAVPDPSPVAESKPYQEPSTLPDIDLTKGSDS